MSTGETEGQAEQQSTTETEESASLLETAIAATKKTERSRAEELIKTLTEEALKGTVTFDKDVMRSINAAIAGIDAKMSTQLAAIMHHEKFQKLEGSWRGLHHLVQNSETGDSLKIRVLNCGKRELFKDMDRAVEFDQSQLFKKLYEDEFGTPGGAPYGALIGDYEFTNHPEDIDLLTSVSGVAASAFCPFISATAPQLFGFDEWTELSKPRDLARIFDSAEYTKWKSFRESEDSRFCVLTMPRTLARLPYGANTKTIDEFAYEEVPVGRKGESIHVAHNEFCWMNTAYVMGTKLTDAFAKTGFCTTIRGVENGGKVEGLPSYIFKADDGDMDLKCPTEIAITDRREKELSDLGFLPLCHFKNTDYSVFFGAQTTQKPKLYDRPEATANAAISARLPYIMATSRFSHYLKVLGRDKIGSFMEASDCEAWLDRWIHNYVTSDPNPPSDVRARYPLAEARVEVKEIPGKPGSYNAVAWMRPWLQMEELTTSMRMVASIPKLG
ncbi:type VI secretion system contractile sheath large subunit [Stieleria sp. ICT_E10.1]|uniref:type VI secretion system contractile sheath large subunit n=1 Tax=Stieleria sedimenti TaxID=2976331 RepID=UPI0021802390|nr:type VI secretion system contractile sheath large subunit [Stieleria sedimenti]MCS7466687.1 type VI secretion system contractile sheath large subunit [Stieleria sedimenti]